MIDGGDRHRVIIVYFPLLVALGVGATLGPRSEKICRFAGDMSYPLYMTHYAVIWSFGEYYERFKLDAVHLTLVVISGVLLLTAFAYMVMIYYDLPIRAFLRSRSVISDSRSWR